MTAYPFNKIGTSFANYDNAGGVQTVVTPAANVNGVIIWQVAMSDGTADTTSYVWADVAAPSSHTDGSKRRIYRGIANGGPFQLTKPIFVPAGNGIYITASVGIYGFVDYEVM